MTEVSLLTQVPVKRGNVLDRFLPAAVADVPEEARKGRLLFAISLMLSFASFFFAMQTDFDQPLTTVFYILFVGGFIGVGNIPLMRFMRSVRLPSIITCIELVFIIWMVGWFGGGTGDASQTFLCVAPLMATFLVGPRAGVVFAGLGALVTFITFWAQTHGVKFHPPDDTSAYFDLLGRSMVLGIVALFAYLYEAGRTANLALVQAAMRELKQRNEEQARLADSLAAARDQALAESRRKDEFLSQMRSFSSQQGDALEKTREATVQLSDTIRAISASVETLATSSTASDSTIAGIASNAGRVSDTVQHLVTGVEDTSRALGALTAAVATVQGHYDDLRTSAESTASAMLEMERSAARVEQNAVRTVQLSDAMIKDAERGQEAMRRSLAGVDGIRASSRVVGDVIRTLEQRVGAIGAINQVIDEVAVETNVLALNASIIAAQAGEKGQGFAVVADQIKGLASRTAASTREINEVIRALQIEAQNAVSAMEEGDRAVEAGVLLSDDAGKALELIVASAREATEEVRGIEQATVEQARRARAVGGAMAEVTRLVALAVKATQQHGQAVQQIESAMSKLRPLAPDLQTRSGQQAEGGKLARAAIARISEMAKKLNGVQGDQKKASEQTLRAIEEIQRAQRGQDEALRRLSS
jgi:methyl-accepting chemotaxis protein